MNKVLEELISNRKIELPDGSWANIENTSISTEEGMFLQKCVKDSNATTSLEVGLAFGCSALFICDALNKNENTRHTVLDPFQNDPNCPWKNGAGLFNLNKAGFESIVEFYEEFSHFALPRLISEGKKVDFVFIDGNHTFDYTLLDFFYADLLLKPGGIVVLDDTAWPAVKKVCSFIEHNRNYVLHDYIKQPIEYSFMQKMYIKMHQKMQSSKRFKPYMAKESIGGKVFNYTYGSMVAYKKVADDNRDFKHFIDF